MIRIGIVGCGRILAAHLRGYRLLAEAGMDYFRITALCARQRNDAIGYIERNPEHPQRPAVSHMPGDPLSVAEEYLADFQEVGDVEVFTDYRQMIASGRIDAVNDFTPHRLHHLVAEQSFEHRKHLLTQKPLAVTVAAAQEMCRRAERAGVTFGVFENAHYRPHLLQAAWAMNGGPAGRPQMALVGNVGAMWAPDRVVANTPWRHDRLQAGGLTIDLGVHQFHTIRQVIGEPRTITGRVAVLEPRRFIRDDAGRVLESVECDADDTCFASFETQNGALGTLFTSLAGRGTKTVLEQGPVFYGERGRVTGDTISLQGQPVRSLASVYCEKASAAQQSADFPLGLSDHFALTQYHWLEAIRHRTQPPLDGRQGLLDLACAYCVLESHVAGRTVEVSEVLSGELAEYQRPINEAFGISAAS